MKNEKTMVTVPYIAYEKAMDDKKLVIKIMSSIIISLVVAIVVTIVLFMSFINKCNFTSYDQDGNGVNNINSGTQGDVSNGTTTKDNN